MIHRTPLLDVKLHAAGFYPLDATWEISRLPLIDRLHRLPSGECLFARLDYRDAVAWCNLHGCELPTAAQLEQARAAGLTIRPCVQFIAADLATCERHDALVWGWLAAAGWAHGVPVTGAGKHWVKGAPAGRSWLMGWWTERVEAYGSKRTGPGWVQQAPAAGSLGPHDDRHVDYSSTTLVVRRRGTVDVDGDTDPAGWTEAAAAAALDALRPAAAAVRAHVARLLDEGAREWSSTAEPGGHVLPPGAGSQPGGHVLAASKEGPMRQTIRLGSKGADVTAWQTIIGAPVDGAFGPGTEAATMAWQDAHGLAPDGVVGPRAWTAAGETPAPLVAAAGDQRAPACLAALRDANAACPRRSRRSDGIMGDARHQASKSSHNAGNAVDVTHDPANGCDCNALALAAMGDPRVQYIIWDRRIWNVDRAAEGWRAYSGSNGHTHHMHLDIKPALRGDAGPWPWAPPPVVDLP